MTEKVIVFAYLNGQFSLVRWCYFDEERGEILPYAPKTTGDTLDEVF